jgi:hypothetical protein
MKKLFIILIIVSFSLHALEPIPDMLPKAGKANQDLSTWHSSTVGYIVQEGENVRPLMAVKSKIDILKDGTFIIPVFTPEDRLTYLRVDCETKTVESLGEWSKNSFNELGNFGQRNLLDNRSVGYDALHHVCILEIPMRPEVAKLLFIGMVQKTYRHETYDLNSIQKVGESSYIMNLGEINDSNDGNNYRYVLNSKYKFQFDCREKSYSFFNYVQGTYSEKYFLNNLAETDSFLFYYPVERSCEYIKLNPKGQIDKNLNINNNENPIKKDNIEKFKKECEELGFTPNTESFGECVLELM